MNLKKKKKKIDTKSCLSRFSFLILISESRHPPQKENGLMELMLDGIRHSTEWSGSESSIFDFFYRSHKRKGELEGYKDDFNHHHFSTGSIEM